MLAAPFAAIVMIVLVLTMSPLHPNSRGIAVPLLRLQRRTNTSTCDGGFIFVRLLANGETTVNGRKIPSDKDLAALVHNIMETRAERVVYVVPDTQLEYGRFIWALGILKNASSDLHLAVLSGKLRDEYFERDLEPCDITWP